MALARALVNYPSALLLDEPLGALDLKLRQAMQIELKRIQREVGITFIYVTHDQEEALTMSDRIAVMNEGRVEQIGTPEEIYHSPATVFVANFIGVANLLPATVVGLGEDRAVVTLDGDRRMECAAPAGPPSPERGYSHDPARAAALRRAAATGSPPSSRQPPSSGARWCGSPSGPRRRSRCRPRRLRRSAPGARARPPVLVSWDADGARLLPPRSTTSPLGHGLRANTRTGRTPKPNPSSEVPPMSKPEPYDESDLQAIVRRALSRRQFLGRTAVAAGGLAFGGAIPLRLCQEGRRRRG